MRHFEGLARTLASAQFVVDIGSNDGILLKPLKELGVKALGIEPSINVSKIANDNGLTTLCSFFDAKTAAEVERTDGKADVIIATSVFTHLEDPHDFIEAAKALLTDDGRFIIEVEYIGNILRHVQFERFYLDRIFYYSLTSLTHLFDAHGMLDHRRRAYRAAWRIVAGHGPAEGRRTRAVAASVGALLKEEDETPQPRQARDSRRRSTRRSPRFRKVLEDYKASGIQGRRLWRARAGIDDLQLRQYRPVADRIHGR